MSSNSADLTVQYNVFDFVVKKLMEQGISRDSIISRIPNPTSSVLDFDELSKHSACAYFATSFIKELFGDYIKGDKFVYFKAEHRQQKVIIWCKEKYTLDMKSFKTFYFAFEDKPNTQEALNDLKTWVSEINKTYRFWKKPKEQYSAEVSFPMKFIQEKKFRGPFSTVSGHKMWQTIPSENSCLMIKCLVSDFDKFEKSDTPVNFIFILTREHAVNEDISREFNRYIDQLKKEASQIYDKQKIPSAQIPPSKHSWTSIDLNINFMTDKYGEPEHTVEILIWRNVEDPCVTVEVENKKSLDGAKILTFIMRSTNDNGSDKEYRDLRRRADCVKIQFNVYQRSIEESIKREKFIATLAESLRTNPDITDDLIVAGERLSNGSAYFGKTLRCKIASILRETFTEFQKE